MRSSDGCAVTRVTREISKLSHDTLSSRPLIHDCIDPQNRLYVHPSPSPFLTVSIVMSSVTYEIAFVWFLELRCRLIDSIVNTSPRLVDCRRVIDQLKKAALTPRVKGWDNTITHDSRFKRTDLSKCVPTLGIPNFVTWQPRRLLLIVLIAARAQSSGWLTVDGDLKQYFAPRQQDGAIILILNPTVVNTRVYNVTR